MIVDPYFARSQGVLGHIRSAAPFDGRLGIRIVSRLKAAIRSATLSFRRART